MHTQVKLKRQETFQTAWIPSKAAIKGYKIELKEDGLFWEVVEVYSELPDNVVKENERNYKSHRKATDI